MIEIISKMLFCLLVAASIGGIIGYILGRIKKCDEKEEIEEDINKIYEEKEINQDNNFTVGNTHKYKMLTSEKEEVEAEPIDEESEKVLQKIVLEDSGLMPISETYETNKKKMKKPDLKSMPDKGKPDDLKEISGIGVKLEKLLNDLGVYYFSQIAEWNEENLNWIDEHLGVFKGRAKRDKWIEQAKILAKGGETEFSKRVKRGEIDRY